MIPKFKRILVKLSGEALAGNSSKVFDSAILEQIAREVQSVRNIGVQVGIVIGGGNIFRGARQLGKKMDRVQGDHMGMLATIINALAIQSFLEQLEIPTRVMTAFPVQTVAEPFIRRKAISHLEKGYIVIFAGGTGNPYFTTDTAATLRATEIRADVILKATQVDGVYSDDPQENPNATRIKEISYTEVLKLGLKIMDLTAIAFAMDNKIPIGVFSLQPEGNLLKVVLGEPIASWVSGDTK
ncbi:MAG: UMP kinase [bacterium]|nr:UMP kinase [bacterium]